MPFTTPISGFYAVCWCFSRARINNIRRTVDLNEKFATIHADRIQIQQVVLNLIRNACEALSKDDGCRRDVTVSTLTPDDRSVEIRVIDSGRGLSVDDPEQLFEAFFTTKRDGMGLGLAISRSIVESHGGRLTAEQGSGGGAIFRVCLPSGRSSGKKDS